MNLYANFVSVDGTKVTYRVGFSTKDITGIVVYDYELNNYEIIEQPSSGDLSERAVESMFIRHRRNFVYGIFPEKISREIG